MAWLGKKRKEETRGGEERDRKKRREKEREGEGEGVKCPLVEETKQRQTDTWVGHQGILQIAGGRREEGSVDGGTASSEVAVVVVVVEVGA